MPANLQIAPSSPGRYQPAPGWCLLAVGSAAEASAAVARVLCALDSFAYPEERVMQTRGLLETALRDAAGAARLRYQINPWYALAEVEADQTWPGGAVGRLRLCTFLRCPRTRRPLQVNRYWSIV